ncbi:MAG TPA: serine hydrolase domain-containing protein [Allosphingosinicella sp.]|jgi:CubicO group peptidase (beta-lactamase class C family)
MKPFHIVAACLLLGSQWPAGQTQAAGRRDFADNLRRSVAVAGREDERFRLADRMAHYLVPGVSVAVIEDCRIVDDRAFGRAAPAGGPATSRTLFQAGSISKTFTAIAALRLVEQGALSLDGDVRQSLTSWKLPDSPLLQGRTVTLRGLLSHTAGINQEGGIGYSRDASLPSLLEILEGRPPANTAPIRVERAPGSGWRYSGGGYYIAQALMSDATALEYPKLMERLVFRPLRMRDSSFSQPLDRRLIPFAARAAGPDGSPLEGGWRVNPELAAGGLWTTPSDVARLAIAAARAVRGESAAFLGPNAAREFMKRGPGNWGLGVDLGPSAGSRRFGHTGHNVGFSSEFVFYPDTCQGAVVMTNADQGGWLVAEVLRAIGDSYGWPDRTARAVQAAIPITPAIVRRFVGQYRLKDFPAERFTISRRSDGLYWARAGHVGRELLAESAGRLFSPDSRMSLEAADPGAEQALTLSLSFGGGMNVAERTGD